MVTPPYYHQKFPSINLVKKKMNNIFIKNNLATLETEIKYTVLNIFDKYAMRGN